MNSSACWHARLSMQHGTDTIVLDRVKVLDWATGREIGPLNACLAGWSWGKAFEKPKRLLAIVVQQSTATPIEW